MVQGTGLGSPRIQSLCAQRLCRGMRVKPKCERICRPLWTGIWSITDRRRPRSHDNSHCPHPAFRKKLRYSGSRPPIGHQRHYCAWTLCSTTCKKIPVLNVYSITHVYLIRITKSGTRSCWITEDLSDTRYKIIQRSEKHSVGVHSGRRSMILPRWETFDYNDHFRSVDKKKKEIRHS